MKLRLRSFESKETLRIEVPISCTLHHLKQILSEILPNSPPSAFVRLSLNRKDEFLGPSPDGVDSLQSLGITTGDLIFFTVDANSVQPTQIPQSNPSLQSQSESSLPVNNPEPVDIVSTDSHNSPLRNPNFFPDQSAQSSQNALVEAQNSDSVNSGADKGKSLDVSAQMGETMDYMDVDNGGGDETDGFVVDAVEKSFSVPGFLRKVFSEELGDDSGRDHKLIVIAIHAVLLESGFVRFDVNSNKEINGFQAEWPSSFFRLSLFYTVPAIVSHAGSDPINHVVLRFQTLGKFINVYGSLGNGTVQCGTHWVRLNEDQLAPFLNVVWANCGLTENISGNDGAFLGTSPEKEVFTFWRNVKDNMALPLLIDICEKSGLELPPCFMRLPTDLKMKILESLPAVDIAKVCCVCSELQYLASGDDLWKLKFAEIYGVEGVGSQGGWKKTFQRAWMIRKLRTRGRLEHGWSATRRMMRHPNPYMIPRAPRIIGGNHDIWPSFGDRLQMRLPMRYFSPQCNLGGTSGRNIV